MKTIAKKDKMEEWTKEEKQQINLFYGCEILYEKATIEQIKDSSSPSDAYLVYYETDSKKYVDVCRGRKRADIFDLYYDKYKEKKLKKIDFGYGKVNPRIWGYKPSENKKRK
ncbi:MAG: Synechococcus phage [Bacteroidota bacterium]